jgi:hypothetical protein
LVHLVGLGLVVRQRFADRGGQRAGLDLMPEPQQMLATDADLAGELGGGLPLGDAAEDQEDLCGAVMGTLPGGVGVHVEDAVAALAAVIDDRGVGSTAVNVEAVPGATTGAGEPLGVEQVEELLATTFLIHQVEDRKIHGIDSRR